MAYSRMVGGGLEAGVRTRTLCRLPTRIYVATREGASSSVITVLYRRMYSIVG